MSLTAYALGHYEEMREIKLTGDTKEEEMLATSGRSRTRFDLIVFILPNIHSPLFSIILTFLDQLIAPRAPHITFKFIENYCADLIRRGILRLDRVGCASTATAR